MASRHPDRRAGTVTGQRARDELVELRGSLDREREVIAELEFLAGAAGTCRRLRLDRGSFGRLRERDRM